MTPIRKARRGVEGVVSRAICPDADGFNSEGPISYYDPNSESPISCYDPISESSRLNLASYGCFIMHGLHDLFKMWVYICRIYWIFSHLNTTCKSKATNAIIPLLLHNKTSVTRRYFFMIKNRTFHVENNVCLKSWCTFARFVEFFRT